MLRSFDTSDSFPTPLTKPIYPATHLAAMQSRNFCAAQVARFTTDVLNTVNTTDLTSSVSAQRDRETQRGSVSVQRDESAAADSGQPVLWTDDNALEFVAIHGTRLFLMPLVLTLQSL